MTGWLRHRSRSSFRSLPALKLHPGRGRAGGDASPSRSRPRCTDTCGVKLRLCTRRCLARRVPDVEPPPPYERGDPGRGARVVHGRPCTAGLQSSLVRSWPAAPGSVGVPHRSAHATPAPPIRRLGSNRNRRATCTNLTSCPDICAAWSRTLPTPRPSHSGQAAIIGTAHEPAQAPGTPVKRGDAPYKIEPRQTAATQPLQEPWTTLRDLVRAALLPRNSTACSAKRIARWSSSSRRSSPAVSRPPFAHRLPRPHVHNASSWGGHSATPAGSQLPPRAARGSAGG